VNDAKYIDLDVHQATISATVLDSTGKLVMESILETKATTVLQFIDGLRGSLHVTFEEGTCAAWLHDLLKPHVTQVVVCDPQECTAESRQQKRSHRFAETRRTAALEPSAAGLSHGVRTVKELARSYLTITKDLTRVMTRLQAIYRSWAIPCASQQVYAPRYRAEWLAKISEAGVRRRAELYYQQLDALRTLRQEARRDLLAEGRKHGATRLLRQIPSIGPIRAVLLLALIQTPHRFRTKRQLWAYGGLALEARNSGEYCMVRGQFKRSTNALAVIDGQTPGFSTNDG